MGQTFHSELLDAAESAPDRIAAMSIDGSTGEAVAAVTYTQLVDTAARSATGLAELGVERGDTVAVMTNNRWEFSALVFAISQLGAVYTGIPVAAAAPEAAHMLRTSHAKVLVVPATGRGDPLSLADSLLAQAQALEHVVVLDDEGERGRGFIPFAALLEADPSAPAATDAASLAHLGFTSGTTGPSKAVMNTHETLLTVCRRWVGHVGGRASFGDPAVNLVASPVGHHTGFLWGALLSAHLAGTAVYLERWIPKTAARVIADQGVTTMHGAPTFLHDLLRTTELDASAASTLRIVTLAGAPIPRQMVPDARERLGAFICPAWGMTEYGIGISARRGMAATELDASDGFPVAGCEVRIVLDDEEAHPHQSGSLQVRGPGLFKGYFEDEEATAAAIDGDGWFATGDVARIDPGGTVTLEGRTKDIIIRGGQNIPVGEIETVLCRHPAIVEAAVVGVADDRLGERACAVVVCEPGSTIELEEVVQFCRSQGVSKHHLPEYLELREALAKTMSGKVRKAELRGDLAADPPSL